MSAKIIRVLAGSNQTSVLDHQCDIEEERETLADANRRARYVLTEEYRRNCEATTRLGYAQVLVNGVVVADYFAKVS